MEQTECSETSAYKIQAPGNYPKESIQVIKHVSAPKVSNRTLFYLSGIRNARHMSTHR